MKQDLHNFENGLSLQLQTPISQFEFVEKCRRASHDLKSPLSSLNLVLSQLREIPDSHRELIELSLQRINDIARDLLKDTPSINSYAALDLSPIAKIYKAERSTENTYACPLTISEIIQKTVKEKSFEYLNFKNIKLQFEDHTLPQTFAKIENSKLQRILSNLINNSVEALHSRQGTVKIAVSNDIEEVKILVQDNGCGMPIEILNLLGKKIVSYGKTFSNDSMIHHNFSDSSGNGIGVYSAQRVLEEVGGRLQYFSKEGLGTTAVISLKKLPNYQSTGKNAVRNS